jgi:sugar phosphate isomerase/epimerase
MKRPRVALMLYTVRDACEADLPGTLAMIREAGYEWVELAGLAGRDAESFRRELDAAGLRACGAHHGLDELREPQRVIDASKTLGYTRAVMPYTETRDREGFTALLAELETAFDALVAGGVELCYHNHDFEFAPFDGGGSMWQMVEASSLSLEIDLGWAWFAGRDPAALIERHKGRTPMLHFKDLASRDGDARYTAVGEGGVPWSDILRANGAAEFAIVEQDELYGEDLAANIARSYKALDTLLGEACGG